MCVCVCVFKREREIEEGGGGEEMKGGRENRREKVKHHCIDTNLGIGH